MMTERGTFIINGTERVVVSQLVRSPGVYFSRELDKTTDKDVYIAKIIPSRGAWLEFDVDKKDTVGVRIDRKRRQNVTVLLKALGWSTDEILSLFDGADSIKNTLEKDHFETSEEALEDIYRKLRPESPRRPNPLGRCSRTCSSTTSATTWRGWVGTRSTRSSRPRKGAPVPAERGPSS